ncbi:DUF6220 domain-containing protein [Virgibacillus siamensis]|uniref:DUF6220 domain-containing protein n=1 Tax=Virgibacillus siamensis TaxID=480071 RepID=UPI000987B33C|nr:DUF6220 domain-containing protein [Virgibacillus siamensis]
MKQNRNRLIQKVFGLLALLFFLGIIIQVFLAGIALFMDIGKWHYHTTFIHYVEFIPLVMLVISFFGGIPTKFRWQCAGLYLLIVIQYITANLAGSVPYLAAFHPIVALLLFLGSLVITRKSLFAINHTKK